MLLVFCWYLSSLKKIWLYLLFIFWGYSLLELLGQVKHFPFNIHYNKKKNPIVCLLKWVVTHLLLGIVTAWDLASGMLFSCEREYNCAMRMRGVECGLFYSAFVTTSGFWWHGDTLMTKWNGFWEECLSWRLVKWTPRENKIVQNYS